MIKRALIIAAISALPFGTSAQEFKVNFGIPQSAPNAPIEVAADSLSVDQTTGNAVFDGNVIIEQGSMRMEAAQVAVTYSEDSSSISKLVGNGGVKITSGTDIATADMAEYDVITGLLKMQGDVSLKQGRARINAGRMDVNLNDSTAALHGNVRTVLQTGNN